MSEHKPMGLAAVARAAKDPRITVTALVSAIEAGTIEPTVENGKNLITLDQALSIIAPAEPAAEEEAQPSAPIKFKRAKYRRETDADRDQEDPSGD